VPVPVEPYPEPLSIEHDHPSLSVDADTVEALIRHAMEAEGARPVHVSVVLSDHDTVRRLNAAYLDHDYNTDVLSFSLRDEDETSPPAPTAEGEVYVDLDTAEERHEEFDTTFERETYRYVVHGVLHLLGYDDGTEDGQETMRALEDQYLDAVLSEDAAG
jgi:probable rRNA maturation factor